MKVWLTRDEATNDATLWCLPPYKHEDGHWQCRCPGQSEARGVLLNGIEEVKKEFGSLFRVRRGQGICFEMKASVLYLYNGQRPYGYDTIKKGDARV